MMPDNTPTIFKWRTMDGRVLTLGQMDTKHLFNSMKMVYNHLAAACGVETVWFTKQYGDYLKLADQKPIELARIIVIFCNEIMSRGDLPAQYREPFARIMSNLSGQAQLAPAVKLLNPPKRKVMPWEPQDR